jgi:hypothetical protein
VVSRSFTGVALAVTAMLTNWSTTARPRRISVEVAPQWMSNSSCHNLSVPSS